MDNPPYKYATFDGIEMKSLKEYRIYTRKKALDSLNKYHARDY